MKKFLSLVLAMIMTMSLVTISAGATEYKDLTDKDEIQYEEAVAVLNRIGVITGYDDGSFRPEGELTRGAAAKIIVSLLIGPEAANNLPNATAPYPDVPASHTFAGVISYCKTAKIISGYGDGTFKPGNSLTGFAFAKMLLGALGYKQEVEGFVDTGWTMNVAKVGNVVGLFDRLDFDGSASVNREEACQLALNTLKATMVTYGGTTMVTGAQNMFVQGTQAMYVTSNNREINANINRRVISAQNNELTLEFGEEHFKDLRLEHDKYDPAYDDFGHPSNEWSWKKVTIGTFKLPADFTYTNQVAYREDTVASKEKALGLRGYDTYSTDHRGTSYNWSSPLGGGSYTGVNSPFDDATQITINGFDARANAYGALVSYDASKINNKDDAPTLSEIADLTDNGVTVEVYVCPVDADFITNVVVTRTQMMEVKRIGSDYVTLDRIDPDSRDPRKDEAEKDSMQGLRDITGYNAFAVDVDTLDVKDNNYDAYATLKDLKAGDKVAVIPFTADQGKTWEVGEAYVPETVSGKLSDVGLYMNTSKTDGNATSITVGGTKYVINEWNLDMIDVKKAQINATRKDVTAYLAKDGTVLWATEIGNSDDWMIVGDYYQAANSNGKVVWFAHGWTLGGEEVDVDLGTIRKEAEYYAPGELVHYQLAQGGTGEYELGKPNNTGYSSWYSNDGNQIPEDRLTKTVNNKKEYSGEGVYNVAQFVLNNGVSKPYSIHPANSLIALEDYTNYLYPTTANTAVGGAIYAPETDAKRDGTTPAWTPTSDGAHTWNYRSTTYNNDGVKFIYVNFDSVTGNVDYISTRKDAQTVENAELAGYNKWWSNTATNVSNDQRNWVVSPAEAYVNDDGNVEAVVIKCEPAQADLSNVIIVGEFVGTEYGKTGAETSATNPSNVSAREYWQGPTFSEKKTGYFKNGHNVGDIVVIRSTDANNVMDCKMFNGGNFENRNPDVFAANGIAALKSAMDEKSKVAFYVGKNTGDTVLSQNGKINLISSKADIMSDIKVEAEDWDDLTELKEAYYAGLIKVAGAKWIDLRANRGSDEVESLGDLLDLDNDTVQIKVLLNAKSSTETFRRAYAIVVLRGYKLNQIDIPELSIQAVENASYVDAKKGDGTAKNPWVFEVEAGKQARLHGVFKNASKLTGKVTSKVWTVNDRIISSDFVSDNDSIWVDAPEVKGDEYGKIVSWTVTVRDDTKTDRRTASTTVYAKVVVKSDVGPVVEYADVAITNVDPAQTVTFTAAGQETVTGTTTAKLVKGVTYAVSVPAGYKVDKATVVAGTDTAVTVTKVDETKATVTISGNTDNVDVTFTATGKDPVVGKTEVELEKDVTYAVSVPAGYSVTPASIVAGGAVTAVTVSKDAADEGHWEFIDGELVWVEPAAPTALSEAQETEPQGEEVMTSIQNASPLDPYKGQYVRISNSAIPSMGQYTVYVTTNAAGKTVLKFGKDLTADAMNAMLKTLNDSGLKQLAFQAKFERVATTAEADAWNGKAPTILSTNGKVQATLDPATMTATFYSYAASQSKGIPVPLTDSEIEAAVSAALNGAKVTYSRKDETVSTADAIYAVKVGSANAGGVDNPHPLYKVTIKGTSGEQYVRGAAATTNANTLIVNEGVVGLLRDDVYAVTGADADACLTEPSVTTGDLSKKGVAVEGGKVNLKVLGTNYIDKDTVLVPVVLLQADGVSQFDENGAATVNYELTLAVSGRPGTQKASDGTTVDNAAVIPTGAAVTYIQEGAELIISSNATWDAGTAGSGLAADHKLSPYTLVVNGAEKTGKFGPNGEFSDDYAIRTGFTVREMDNGKLSIALSYDKPASDVYTVKMNDTEVGKFEADNEWHSLKVTNFPTNAQVAYETRAVATGKKGLTALTATTIEVRGAQRELWLKMDPATVNTWAVNGVINLYTAYEVVDGTVFSLSSKPNKTGAAWETEDQIAANTLVKAGTSIYFMSDAYKTLGIKTGEPVKNLDVSFVSQIPEGGDAAANAGKCIWKIVVNDEVSTGYFVATASSADGALDLSAPAITGATVPETKAGSTVEMVVAITDLTKAKFIDINNVSASWSGTASPDIFQGAPVVTRENDNLVITVKAINDLEAGDVLGSLTIYIGGIRAEAIADVTVA